MLGQEEINPEWTLRKRKEKNMGSGGSVNKVFFSLLVPKKKVFKGE